MALPVSRSAARCIASAARSVRRCAFWQRGARAFARLPLLLLLLGPSALAAVQGDPGTTSTGNVDINLVTGLNVRISGLADMPLGVWDGVNDVNSSDNLCIGRTGVSFFGSGPYRILASGDGEPSDPAAFTLSNGASRISYNAFFNDQTGTAGRQALTPGVALTGQSGFGFWQILNYLFGCSVDNANVSIVVPASELSGAAGVYTGTLTLILIPE